MLLVLTNRHDLTVDFVITRLLAEGKEYFRLNSDDLATHRVSISVSPDRRWGVIETEHHRVDLERLRSVWYRRSVDPNVTAVPGPESDFARDEFAHLYEGYLLRPGLRWVNPFAAAHIGERKVLQLHLATAMGLRVPRTLVSNDPREIRAFIERVGPAICKPISRGFYADDQGGEYAIFTRRVSSNDLVDDSELAACPTLFQEEVSRGCDIRLTIIGRTAFATEIRTDPPMVDWRQPGTKLEYRLIEPHQATLDRCLRFMDQLGLVFGAFDFIRDPNGEWVFLEVNPTGEWAWLERELQLPMTTALLQTLDAW